MAGQAVLEVTPGSAEAALGVAVEPPARTAAALDALYGWADVVLLPSRFEGVPLTVLEAQRLGCVVVATRVGAVAEIMTDGIDGILVPAGGRQGAPEPAVVDALVAALEGLDHDRGRLAAIGAAAAARLEGAGWSVTMRDFLDHLDVACPAGPAP